MDFVVEQAGTGSSASAKQLMQGAVARGELAWYSIALMLVDSAVYVSTCQGQSSSSCSCSSSSSPGLSSSDNSMQETS